MLFPALQDASRDEALNGTPHSVYLWLACNLLEFGTYRPIKLDGVAMAVGVHRDTVSKAMALLVARGYLQRRYVEREGYEYLLLMHRQRAA